MLLSELKGSFQLFNPDTVSEYLKLGGTDYEVFLDAKGRAYCRYDERIMSPVFTPFLSGYAVEYPNVDDVRSLVADGTCVEIHPSLNQPPTYLMPHVSIWDNYYINYKEDMWRDVNSNRRRKVNKVLSGSAIIRNLTPNLKNLYDLAYNYWIRHGDLFALDFFRYFISANTVLEKPIWLGLFDGEHLLGIGHFSVNSRLGGKDVFSYNQYMSVESRTSASEFLLKAGYFLAEKYGDILVDTTYRCDYGDVPVAYEYKKQISNSKHPVYGLFIKSKNTEGFTPPYLEI